MQKRASNVKALTMQALSVLPMPHSFFNLDDFASVPTKPISNFNEEHKIHNDDIESIGEQEDFSFAGIDPQGTLIFADEIFENGQIRPFFNQSLDYSNTQGDVSLALRSPLKKLLIQQCNSLSLESIGTSKDLHKESSQNIMMVEVEASNKKCQKSNSTGFSKIWRFRQYLKHRSNSDGEDVFVSINPSMSISKRSNKEKVENIASKKEKGDKHKKTVSAHEKLYVMNRNKKENSKRRSFLPYRKELIGFFANRNGFSKNLHSF
ncbi:uncharacterized protein LOC113866563 [Abrus precatorius]|uniref:Uncharacterized protein LOC113866563 n=1 Tax=Abrus precatorius TaxID=3816 RepID=A0A8B8LQN2_ABRPR|nr:uncharacterized protein LOC113866563 [Abrus precatorius]